MRPEIVFVITGTLAEAGGLGLQMLQEVREGETEDFIPEFWERHFCFPMTGKIPLLPTALAKIWRRRHGPPLLATTFMPGSLPEASPTKVYEIHEMRFPDDLFIGTSMADKTTRSV